MSAQDDRDTKSSTEVSTSEFNTTSESEDQIVKNWAKGLKIGGIKESQEIQPEKIFSGFEIDQYANLANLVLTDEEKDLYSEQLQRIIRYCVVKLNQTSATDIEPTFNVTGQSNVMREDKTISSLSQEEALSNAPKKKDGMFETKGVFDE